MAITASTIQRSLRDAYDDSILYGRTLRDQLRLCERAAGSPLAGPGGSIGSVSAAGVSTSYDGRVTAQEVADLWTRLVNLCDLAIATLGPGAIDADIYTVMLSDRLLADSVTGYRPDFSLLGWRPLT